MAMCNVATCRPCFCCRLSRALTWAREAGQLARRRLFSWTERSAPPFLVLKGYYHEKCRDSRYCSLISYFPTTEMLSSYFFFTEDLILIFPRFSLCSLNSPFFRFLFILGKIPCRRDKDDVHYPYQLNTVKLWKYVR